MINNCYFPDIKRHRRSPGGWSPRRHWAPVQSLEGFVLNPSQGVIRLLHVGSLHDLSYVLVVPKTQRSGHTEHEAQELPLGAKWLCKHSGQLRTSSHLTATPWTYVSSNNLLMRTNRTTTQHLLS